MSGETLSRRLSRPVFARESLARPRPERDTFTPPYKGRECLSLPTIATPSRGQTMKVSNLHCTGDAPWERVRNLFFGSIFPAGSGSALPARLGQKF